MPADKPTAESVLTLHIGNPNVVATTIHGDEFRGNDIVLVKMDAVVLTFNIMPFFSGDNEVRFDEILRIRDESQCSIKELYRKQDPLFDDIKEMLGYKMHESEIWMIVNLVRRKSREERLLVR